jgi:hypothetical protein
MIIYLCVVFRGVVFLCVVFLCVVFLCVVFLCVVFRGVFKFPRLVHRLHHFPFRLRRRL